MTTPYDFELHKREWRSVPVDGVGYFDTQQMLTWPDERVATMIAELERTRYATADWRNHGGRWRAALHSDDTRGKRVLDFGCGAGVEALQFAKTGNEVVVADINESSVQFAQRAIALHGYGAEGVIVTGEAPFFATEPFDVFFSCGVVHHFPHVEQVLRRAVELLRPGGEIRLLLYSDRLWRNSTGAALPPIEMPIEQHPCFKLFYSSHDPCGRYADWYDRAKLEYRFGNFLRIDEFEYVSSNEAFVVATMRPK